MITKLDGNESRPWPEDLKSPKDLKWCVIVMPAIVNYQGQGLDGHPQIKTEFRPMNCLEDKCATYWCEEHGGCLKKCEYLHDWTNYNAEDEDSD